MGKGPIAGQHDGAAFTVSVHCAENFPARKAASDRDIALPRGTGNDAYLQALESELPALLDRARPELVLYGSGVDVHNDDRLGHFQTSDDGLYRRDALVIAAVRERDIPLAGVIGGGYDRDVPLLAARHARHFRAAVDYLAAGAGAKDGAM